MTTLGLLGRSALVALGSMVVQAIAATALLHPAPEGAASGLPLVLASNLLAALVYVSLAERSPLRHGRLLAFLMMVAFGIPALYLIEAVFFDIGISPGVLASLYLFSFSVATAAAVLAAVVTGKLKGGPPVAPAEVPVPWARLVLSALSYVVFYFAAGIIAWPYLKFFYEGRAMPAVGQVALLQVFRGAALSLIAWWIARNVLSGRGRAALSAGTLSLIGGVVPLMVPNNEFMPDAVRYVHLVEVGISNFLFGALAACWMTSRPGSVPSAVLAGPQSR